MPATAGRGGASAGVAVTAGAGTSPQAASASARGDDEPEHPAPTPRAPTGFGDRRLSAAALPSGLQSAVLFHVALHFRTAARAEALLDAFAATVRDAPLGGALAREAVVVARATAMRATVEQTLARRVGCAASVDLQSPRLFVAEMARRFGLVPPAPAGRAYEQAALAWRIAALLPTLADSVYAPLHAYLERQRETERPGGAFALATRLAAAFDDYQVYRPDVLRAWAEGTSAVPRWPHEAWQADLWRRLLAEPLADGAERDRATLVRDLTARLRRRVSADVLASFPERVSVFGAPLLPPAYLGVLTALARHVDVTIYAALPALDAGAPFGSSAEHPLARALGGHTRDAADLFDAAEVPAPVHAPALRLVSGQPTALAALHAALHTDAPPRAAVEIAPDDRSVRVLDAHSPLREVEALRDELYDAFDAIPGLRPSDVAVLVPDLATYAPLIEAVFGTSAPRVAGRSRQPALLPVHVANPPRGPERHVLDAFDRLLGLLDGRATASDVLGLLDVPAVRRAAAIEEADLSTLHGWVRQTRVHWGRDADHKTAHGADSASPADDGDLHTWRFGLDRLLLGAMTGPTEALVLGRRPLGEGTLDAADLLGRFAEWLDAVFRSLDALRAPRPLAEWADALLVFVDGVLAPEGTVEVEATVALRAAADRLATLRPDAGAAPVALGEVQAHLAHALAAIDRDEPYLTGRITVVDPTAARLVPFRVVAFVGLDDAYPRTESRPAFDLLAHAPLKGDPDPAGTDRQTFLDTVLSARDRLILSYTGRSQRDGTERAASSVLDAFLDTCSATFGRDAERLVVRHRLQPFSAAYFDGTLFSYAGQHRRPATRTRLGTRFFDPPPADLVAGEAVPVETTLAALGDAWTHPVRAYCGAAGLRPDLADADLLDDAPVELDGLGLYAVKDGLLALLARGATVDEAYHALRGTGVLPPGALGQAWFDRAHTLVADVAERTAAFGTAAPRPVVAETEAWRLEGMLDVSETGALRVRAGRVGSKDLVRGWLDHLALCASDADAAPRQTTVVGQDKTVTFAPLDPGEARLLLQSLVRGALAFGAVPVPLFEHASFAYAQELWKARRPSMTESVKTFLAAEAAGWRPVRVGRALADDPRGLDAYPPAFAAAQKAYDGAWGVPRSDSTDPYVALCYRHQSPLDAFPDALDRWARLLWAPLLSRVEG